MAKLLRLPAPAKLNLMLHIIGRRDDGYHLLETVFQFIELCDWLEFEATDDGNIARRQTNSPVATADDILLRTAHLLQSRYEVSRGVNIGIDKQIPIGGGLGGGSSDAATCLLAVPAGAGQTSATGSPGSGPPDTDTPPGSPSLRSGPNAATHTTAPPPPPRDPSPGHTPQSTPPLELVTDASPDTSSPAPTPDPPRLPKR